MNSDQRPSLDELQAFYAMLVSRGMITTANMSSLQIRCAEELVYMGMIKKNSSATMTIYYIGIR